MTRTPAFLKRPVEKPAPTLHPGPARLEEGYGGAVLACARCLNEVTREGARIPVGASHQHTFTNPHGLRFHIGCFASAMGCVAIGPETRYWTWFPGHSWRVELCVACHEHLGWLFRSADSRFHGLILDRLVELRERA